MRAWRMGLVITGVLLLVLGAAVMVDTVNPQRILGVGLWFVFALILHDGIIAPVVFGVAFLMRKVGRRVPGAVLVIVQGGIVVGSVFSIIVLPEIYARFLGTRNNTVLPFDYAPRLAILWGAVAVLTAIAVGVYAAFTKRQKSRPSVSQA